MKAILISALLASATSFTAAAPTPPTPPAPPSGHPVPPKPACGEATGTIELEIDHRLTGDADPTHYDLVTSTTKLYATGAWQFFEWNAGKQTRTATGCLTADQQKTVHADLARATWKLHDAGIHCQARSLDETAYLSNGKSLYVSQTCPSAVLDDDSAKVVAELDAIKDHVINPKPPCCKPVR